MIRKAAAADLEAVSAIYEAVLDREEATGNHYTTGNGGSTPAGPQRRRP